MATPAEHLHDAVVGYLASLGDNDFRALVAQARPPADTGNNPLGYVVNNDHRPQDTQRPGSRAAVNGVQMGIAEARRRFGDRSEVAR